MNVGFQSPLAVALPLVRSLWRVRGTHPVAEHLFAIGVLTFQGIGVFLVYRWWFYHLMTLAARYDLKQRRKIAGLHYSFMIIPLGIMLIFSLYCIVFYTNISHILMAVGYAASLVPSMVWYLRRTPALREAGFAK